MACKRTVFGVTKNATVIDGGHLMGKIWLAKTITIDNCEFLQLSKGDREFARAIGADMQLRWPLDGYNFIEHVQKLRDHEIDKLLAKYKIKDDPMAEVDNVVIPSVGREKLVKAAQIPDVINITHPEFIVRGKMYQCILSRLSQLAAGITLFDGAHSRELGLDHGCCEHRLD